MNPIRNTGPLLAAAFLLLAGISRSEEIKVAILYSGTTAANSARPFAYQQAFMAAQHQCTMAGIPFKLLDETKLSAAGNFSNYQTLVIPALTHVPAGQRTKYITELGKAANNGLNIISSGQLMAFNENNQPFTTPGLANETIIGVRLGNSFGPAAAELKASIASHPALPGYSANETILTYTSLKVDDFSLSPLALTATSGRYSTLTFSGQPISATTAINTAKGNRNVHFANASIMADSNLLWSAIQWTAYGSQPGVSLRTGRQRSLFTARNDMDQSRFQASLPTVATPLLGVITDWKNTYNFVGSHYINIGNNPANGESTNWTSATPLYQQYLALGNSIGTHSYTHPADISLLTNNQLQFEFKDSRDLIKNKLGKDVISGSIDGNPETLAQIEKISGWLDYLSGRPALSDSNLGFTTAYGHVSPSSSLFYQTVNTSSDTTLIETLGLTPAQAAATWQQELANLHRHAPLPVIHWLWHDSGPVGAATGYNRAMYESMISAAAAIGTEFITDAEFLNRSNEFSQSKLEVTRPGPDSLLVKVSGADFGKFALESGASNPITSVDNWYAYSDSKVFLPTNGGTFTIRTGGTPANVTRITALPPGAELVRLSGDGTNLDFTLRGKGRVTVAVAPGFNIDSLGADAVEPNGDQWDLIFNTDGDHEASATVGDPLPPAPELTFLRSTGININNGTITVGFVSNPNLTGWKLTGCRTFAEGFPFDHTAHTTFTESPAGSGSYTATVSISDVGPCRFFRVERND